MADFDPIDDMAVYMGHALHMEDEYGDLYEQVMFEAGMDPLDDDNQTESDYNDWFDDPYDDAPRDGMVAYEKWEEARMEDSHLLSFLPFEEGVLVSTLKGEFHLRNTSLPRAGYQELYSLANQLLLLISAWRTRVEGVRGDWEDQEQRNEFSLIPWRGDNKNEEMQHPWLSNGNIHPWLSNFNRPTIKKENDINPEERARYSVGRLMNVLGCRRSAEQLVKEVGRVKRMVLSLLLRVLTPSLSSLPYTAMIKICQEVCMDGRGMENICLELEDDHSRLVEKRYITQLYQTLEHLYQAVREIMFKHAVRTAYPSYPIEFGFLRRRLVNTISLIQTLHGLQDEECVGDCESDGVECVRNFYIKESDEELVFNAREYPGNFRDRPECDSSKIHEFLIPHSQSAVAEGNNIFILIKNYRGSLKIFIQDLLGARGCDQGSAIVIDTLVSGLRKEGKISICTPLAVSNNLVAVSLTLGIPRTNVSFQDIVFVFNWVEQQLVWQLDVAHHSTYVAGRFVEDVHRRFVEDNWVIGLDVAICCSDNGNVFLAHCETTVEWDDTIEGRVQHVRLFKQGVEGVYMEFEDINMMDFHRGLMVYRELERVDEAMFVTITLLDVDSGVEVSRKTEVVGQGKWRPAKNISQLPGPKTVMECGGGTLSLYSVEEGKQVLARQINLEGIIEDEVNRNLQLSLVGENLLHMTINNMVFETVKGSVTRHLLVDISKNPSCLGEIFVVDPNFNGREAGFLNVAANKVVAQENTFTLLDICFFPDVPQDVRICRLLMGQTAEEVIREEKERAKQISKKREGEKQIWERNGKSGEQLGQNEQLGQQSDQELTLLRGSDEQDQGQCSQINPGLA